MMTLSMFNIDRINSKLGDFLSGELIDYRLSWSSRCPRLVIKLWGDETWGFSRVSAGSRDLSVTEKALCARGFSLRLDFVDHWISL